MDKVFEEERKHLEETEELIDQLANSHYDYAKTISSGMGSFYSLDYNDIEEKRRLRNSVRNQTDIAIRYEEYKPSPYFGRLDLEDDENFEEETFYIGKKGLMCGGEQIIVDWRSPVGEFFYIKTEKEFTHEENTYNLFLRRSLQIENGRLIEYNTEYDGNDISLGGDVIDPFLLTVLKDKRRQSRLTDIIKTIQGNQNTIIRKPEKESFIVQGCAGSGKTMILLHRLSFLAFNNRYKSYDHIKIITPNKFFDMHINELSKELGLDEIERLTVEEFYAFLIKRYSSRIKVESDVVSEKTMNEEFLREIYSENFQKEIVDKYKKYWNTVLTDLKTLGIFNFIRVRRLSLSDELSYDIQTYDLLKSYITRLLTESTNASKKEKELKERVEVLNSQYVEATNKEKSMLKNIQQIIAGVLDQVDEIVVPGLKAKEEIQIKIDEVKKSIQELKSDDENISVAFLTQISELDKLLSKKISLEILDDISGFASNEIKGKCNEQIKRIRELNEEIKTIPVYNFARKSRVKKDIEQANEIFEQASKSCLMNYKDELTGKLNKENERNRETQLQLNMLKEKLVALSNEYASIDEKYKKYILVKNAFNDNDFPDLKNIISEKEYLDMLPIIKEYISLQTEYETLHTKINVIVKAIEKVKEELRELGGKNLPEEIRECLEKGNDKIEELSLNSVYKNVFLKEMRALYKKNKVKYSKDNYRHKVYMKLIYSMLYFNKATGIPSFINIDEAQDLSIAEYKLLKAILGNNCVFNLYGDVNQLVYSYKGVTDWGDIQKIINSQLYFLNENYRNTIQITEYCNDEFGAEILPIGISGKSVEEKNIAKAIEYIINKSILEPDKRNVVIYRNGVRSISEELKRLLKSANVSWGKIDDKKISVITVEQAKGIEFDNIVVIADQMTPNEKYISFTRAMDELVVVNDEFAKNVYIEAEEDDETEEDIV